MPVCAFLSKRHSYRNEVRIFLIHAILSGVCSESLLRILAICGLHLTISSVLAQIDPVVERGVAREYHAAVVDPEGEELHSLWERLRGTDKAVQLYLEPALKTTWQEKSLRYAESIRAMTTLLHSQRQAELRPHAAELRRALSNLADRADLSVAVIEKEGYPLIDQLADLHRIDWDEEEKQSPGLAAERESLRRIADLRGRLASVLKRKLTTDAPDLTEIEFFATVEGIAPESVRPLLRRNHRAIAALAPLERRAHREYNFYRICFGMLPRPVDPRMVEAAQAYSKERRTLGFHGHNSPVKGRETVVDRAESFQIRIRQEFTAATEDVRVARVLLVVPAYFKEVLRGEGDRFAFGASGGFWTHYLGPGK